jgi:hypothetical protein
VTPTPSQEPLPEIDALMAELDRISGDISKAPATPPKKSSGRAKSPPRSEDDTDTPT